MLPDDEVSTDVGPPSACTLCNCSGEINPLQIYDGAPNDVDIASLFAAVSEQASVSLMLGGLYTL